MKYVKLFEQWLAELERGIGLGRSVGVLDADEVTKGREIYPSDYSVEDFGEPVSSVDDLQIGGHYFIWEPGMDSWQGDYKYSGKIGGVHTFVNDYGTPGDSTTEQPFEFTDAELGEWIAGDNIVEQI